MIFGRNRLEQAICGPLSAPKRPKMAILGSFNQFGAHLANLLAGTRWNSPLKVKIEVWWGNVRSLPSKKSPFRPPTAFKKTKNGQYWPFWPRWPFFGLDQSGTHPLKSRLRLAEVMSGLCPAEKVIFGAPEASKLAKNGQFWPFYLIWHSVGHFFWLELGGTLL